VRHITMTMSPKRAREYHRTPVTRLTKERFASRSLWTSALRTEPERLPDTTDRRPCAIRARIQRIFSVTLGQWRLVFALLKIDFGSTAWTPKDQLIAFTRLRSQVRVL
jgi:hypothetical protein